ncbi:MAG: hypothetical protein IKR59_01395, partial [Lachnospiraceae bacterium]|nr:hypothetical protein [Lachnospiraceae bacterium]
KRVYNVGGGEKARCTGYETFDDGFRLIGGSVEDFFEPKWNCLRNFHCFWLSDSDELESRFHFRTQGCADFWKRYRKRHWIYGAGKLVPVKLLRKLTMEALLKDDNAPSYWLEHSDEARVRAFYGGRAAYETIPENWADLQLFCKSPSYEAVRSEPSYRKLDHGYDEEKEVGALTLQDLEKAAAFRGGECLSSEMPEDCLYGKVQWRCHEGHEFEASLYTILKAGHWCPQCCHTPMEWHMDHIAAHSPFHKQVWQDSHEAGECVIYKLRDGKALMEEES